MKSTDLKAAIDALIREASTNGASLADINRLMWLLKQQHKDEETRKQTIDVPDDEPPEAA
jgi:hypothetical protein